MKFVSREELNKIIREHKWWLRSNGKKGKRANLEGFVLKNVDLYKVDLKRARLCRANLENSNLASANFYKANLEGANLRSANLEGAILSSANLKSADLQDSIMEIAELSDADLQNANLKEADLDEALLTNANLQGANLQNANLFAADLQKANLKNAILKNAILTRASLDGAILDGCNIAEAVLTEGNIDNTDLKDTGDDAVLAESIDRNNENSGIPKTIVIDARLVEEAKTKFIKDIMTAVNPEQIKDAVIEQFGISSIESIKIENGDIFSHKNQIAFRLEFATKILLSCIIDRNGNFIDDIAQATGSRLMDNNGEKSSDLEKSGNGHIVELTDSLEQI
jgi:uncharacterized protein YjbI with pentapeptide repeats